MNPNELDREEEQYQQFNRDSTHPRDRGESQAFQIYARIRHQLRNAKTPPYDEKNLVNRMVVKMGEKPRRFSLYPLLRLAPVTVCVCLSILSLGFCLKTVLSIDWNLTQTIHFYSKANREIPVHPLWKYRLWSGKNVIVPDGIRAVMDLSDGSRLDCQSETQIAVQFGQNRAIDLKSGKITVHASQNTEKPMIVKTPLGEIHVIGTVFTVELTH